MCNANETHMRFLIVSSRTVSVVLYIDLNVCALVVLTDNANMFTVLEAGCSSITGKMKEEVNCLTVLCGLICSMSSE